MNSNTRKTKSNIGRSERPSRVNPDPSATFAWRQVPIDMAIINKMAEELPSWPLLNPDAYFLSEFYVAHGIAKRTFYDLVQRHEHLRDAHQIAMQRLGERMVSKALDNKANVTMAKHIMHMYSDDFNRADIHHSSLRKEELKESGLQVVHLYPVDKTEELDKFVDKKKDKIQIERVNVEVESD